MNDKLMKELAMKYPDKIAPPFDMLFESVSYEAICAICDMYGGSAVYIPSKKRLFSKCFAEEIRKEFDGSNIRELSKKYDICDRSVRYIVSGYKHWK